MTDHTHEEGNGPNNPSRGREPMVVAVESSNVGSGTAIPSLCPSPISSSAINQIDTDLTAANEWDTYIESQQRENWVDIDFKERAFCDEYLENGYKHLDAAVGVGYPRSKGSVLLRKPLLREYMLWVENKRRVRRLVSEHFIDAKLTDLYDQAIGEVDIAMIDKDNTEFEGKRFQGQLALAILQEQGKISGVSKPEIQAQAGGVQVIIDVGALTGANNKIVSEQ